LASLRHRPSQENVRSTTHRLGKTSKPFAVSETLDDFRHEARKSFLPGLAKDGSLIAAIGEQLLRKREIPEQCAQNEKAAVSVLDVGGMNDRMKQ
jgi:hypothetical protein